jgi:hypothetical protein
LRRQYQRFTRVNTSVWMVVLATIAWGVARHVQGTLDLSQWQLLTLALLGIFSAIARTWVGLRDPHVMYSFTIPLATYDILLISVVVAMTGRYASEAWLLYLMLLTSEAAVMTTPCPLCDDGAGYSGLSGCLSAAAIGTLDRFWLSRRGDGAACLAHSPSSPHPSGVSGGAGGAARTD